MLTRQLRRLAGQAVAPGTNLILAGRAPDVPKQRFTAVSNGQQRSD